MTDISKPKIAVKISNEPKKLPDIFGKASQSKLKSIVKFCFVNIFRVCSEKASAFITLSGYKLLL